jgi:uncharacterized membrane protein YoaK (UPF0700 family)
MPALLSFLAGYVDSCTFLALFGLFVAQVTGSFVLAGTLFVTHQNGALIKLLAIPAFFVAGVATTVIVRRAARGRSALPATLGLEAALLAGLFACWLRAGPSPIRMRRPPCSQACSGFRPWGCRAPWCGSCHNDIPRPTS